MTGAISNFKVTAFVSTNFTSNRAILYKANSYYRSTVNTKIEWGNSNIFDNKKTK